MSDEAILNEAEKPYAVATNPVDALAFLRKNSSPYMNDQVTAFQSMPLRDRLEFLFRSTMLLSLQGKNNTEAIERMLQSILVRFPAQ